MSVLTNKNKPKNSQFSHYGLTYTPFPLQAVSPTEAAFWGNVSVHGSPFDIHR